MEQFRALPVPGPTGVAVGKVLVLDEAHKYMVGDGSDGLSAAIVNSARLMRHDGVRLALSTQSPLALAPELLELVTVAALHRFHSRDWFVHLARKLPLEEAAWRQILQLEPGHALLFAARHRLRLPACGAGEGGERDGERGGAGGAQRRVFAVAIRPRITADRGASKTNSGGAGGGGGGGAQGVGGKAADATGRAGQKKP